MAYSHKPAIKPIAIFQHAPTEGPGHFATVLDRRALPWLVVRTDLHAIPQKAGEYAGLVIMGGAMSANDELPWIPPLLDLVRDAVAADIPVLGHCLGGQLMSRVLGGVVSRNPVKEIGWWDVKVADNPEAARWFGEDLKHFTTFQWHGETFSLPPGASPLLSSPYCGNQAFTIGKHLGMQCHVEMDAEMVQSWCESGVEEIAQSGGPAVQSTAEIRRNLDVRLAALNVVADRLYTRWIAGIAG